MKTLTYPTRVRSRDKILASFADLPLSIQGKICDDKRVLASGKTVVYHNLQYWADGKNHTIRIPEEKLQDFREAVKNGVKAKRLLNELSCSDVQTIVSSQPASPLKKKLDDIALRGAERINALVENAVDFLEKHGIACTSRFEQTLFDTMNGTCRELLSAYLEEAAKKHCDYNPVAGERNAGIHTKRITTLFGETEPIGRICYWNKNNSEGHFPFDERLGLVGKYTPAVADEAMRCAAKQPYNEASKEFSRHHSLSLSKDAIREIVAWRAKDVADFVLKHDVSPKEDSSGAIPVVCVMADGTGIPMRKSCLKGVKGKDGAAKTREVKAGAVFIASS